MKGQLQNLRLHKTAYDCEDQSALGSPPWERMSFQSRHHQQRVRPQSQTLKLKIILRLMVVLRGFTVLSEFFPPSSRTIYKKECTEKNGDVFRMPRWFSMHPKSLEERPSIAVVFRHFFHISYLKFSLCLKRKLGYYAKLSTMHVFSFDLRLFSPLEMLKRMQLGVVDYNQRKGAIYGWSNCLFVIVSAVELQQ